MQLDHEQGVALPSDWDLAACSWQRTQLLLLQGQLCSLLPSPSSYPATSTYGTKRVHATGGESPPPGVHATEDRWKLHDSLKDAKGKKCSLHHKQDTNQASSSPRETSVSTATCARFATW
ncbi:UNVERIFIED_CONTAM: hypothetical protein K2H54_037548 [Gekko kuhli]